MHRVGDILLSINDESVIGLSPQKAESCLKGLPKGPFRLTVMAPPRDVTGEGMTSSNQLIGPASSNTPSPVPSLRETVSTQMMLQSGSNEEEIIVRETSLDSAPATAERKSAPDSTTVMHSHSIQQFHSQQEAAHQQEEAESENGGNSTAPNIANQIEAVSNHDSTTPSIDILKSADDPKNGDLTKSTDEDGSNDDLQASLIPEERMTVELRRSPREKFGIGLVGGSDNPNLRHVHVSSPVD